MATMVTIVTVQLQPFCKGLTKKLLSISLSLLFTLSLQGCEQPIAADDYFPLNKGVTWLYKVTETRSTEATTRYFEIKNQGPVDLKDEYSGEPVSIRRTSDGTDYYILQDDTGSYRIGQRTIVETQPRFESKPLRFLPNRQDLEVGRTWTLASQTYAIRSINAAAHNLTGSHPIEMEYEITDIEAKVTTPAGTFEKCVLVEGKAVASIWADPKTGYHDVDIRHREWYAPGVGLVKLERNEPLDLTFFQGGQIRFELIKLGR
ncbi:MAG: hypothetical protein ACPGMR_06665 [Pontibacterium sp.]